MWKWFKIVCGGFVSGIFFALAVLHKWGTGDGLHSDGSGNDAVRDSLQRASEGERRTEERFAGIEANIQRSEDIISRGEERLERSEQLVDEGRNLLRGIRERKYKDPLDDSD